MGGKALMPVTLELIQEVLRLPQGTRILDVRYSFEDRQRGQVTLLVEADGITERPEGCLLPSVKPKYGKAHDAPPQFIEWDESG